MQSSKNILTAIFSCIIYIFLSTSPLIAQPQLLLDMRTGEVLYENQAGKAWYPASLTKLMTALIVFEAISAKKITLDTPIIISKNARNVPPSKSGLPLETAITIKDALFLLIVKSAHDVAIALAETISGSEKAFVLEMNRVAQNLGMTGTNFVNSNGLHNETQISTARDLAILALTIRARYAKYNDLFLTSEVKLGEQIMKTYNNLLTGFLGADGMKTGYICAAGYNIIATAKRNDKYLMAIILGASSIRERGQRTAQLLQKGFSGELLGTGKNIMNLNNEHNNIAKNMRPLICNANDKTYIVKKTNEFPYGLNGQPSFLNNNIIGKRVEINSLGRMRNVPLPRIRPNYFPSPKITNENIAQQIIPIPRPRPNL